MPDATYIVPDSVWVDVRHRGDEVWTLYKTEYRLEFGEPSETVRTPVGELWVFHYSDWSIRVPIVRLLVRENGQVKPLLGPEGSGGIVPRQPRPERPERRARSVKRTPGMKRGVWDR